MNYKKIYKQLIEKAKLENRSRGTTYYESHHIIPDFMFKNRSRKGPKGHLLGNPNDPNNKVLLTEREHIIAHVLLANIHKNTRYWAQAASALSWFFTKVIGDHPRQQHRIAGAMRKYERYRQLGLQGISAARSGNMPVVDAITREMIGSVSVNHPNVLSGKWVHHSKGMHTYLDTQTGKKVYCSCSDERVLNGQFVSANPPAAGESNANYKEFTDEIKQLLIDAVVSTSVNGYIIISYANKVFQPSTQHLSKTGMVLSVTIKNKIGGMDELIEMIDSERGIRLKYDRYYRKYRDK